MHQTDMPMDYHLWDAKANQHCWDEGLFCWWYRVICRITSLILRKSYHFAADFDCVLLQLVDILNTV